MQTSCVSNDRARLRVGGVHHPWLFQALWIKAVTKRHTILQIRQSKAYVLGHIDQEKLIFWFTSAVDDHNMKPQAWQGERRAVALPALLPQTIKLPRRASCYTLAHCMQHQCVYWIWGPVINKFSIFFPPRCLANIKGGKGWCGISVCLSLLLYETARLSAPRHRRGAAAQIQFHDYQVSTWQVGLWFMRFCRVSPAPG